MKACLSLLPAERPSFADLRVLLYDTMAEVAKGTYLDSEGSAAVRPPVLSRGTYLDSEGSAGISHMLQDTESCNKGI